MFHENQIKLLLLNRMRKYNINMVAFQKGSEANKALWGDPFLGKVYMHGWNYESEVAKLGSLIKLYEEDADGMALKYREDEKNRTNLLKKEDDRRRKEFEDRQRAEEEEKKKQEVDQKKQEEEKKKEEEKKEEEEEKN